MTIEVKDNDKIEKLSEAKGMLGNIANDLIEIDKVDIKSHADKIMKLIDNAIKKERIAILNSEIEKIKKGVSNA